MFSQVLGGWFFGRIEFIYGKSTSNQRIQAWWGRLRQGCADWWIEYFKNLRDPGLYNDENAIHRECLKFCFMDLMQEELHRVVLSGMFIELDHLPIWNPLLGSQIFFTFFRSWKVRKIILPWLTRQNWNCRPNVRNVTTSKRMLSCLQGSGRNDNGRRAIRHAHYHRQGLPTILCPFGPYWWLIVITHFGPKTSWAVK